MKRILGIGVLLLVSVLGYGQQQPMFSQYMLNYYIVNPAVAGAQDYIDIKASYRSQWAGLDGAPKSYYFSAHTPLGRVHQKQQRGKKATPHHTVGGYVLGQSLGAFTRNAPYVTYGYHLPINKKFTLSTGVAGGMVFYQLDTEMLDFGDNAGDVVTADPTQLKPDLNLGMWLYSKHLFFGISAMQLLQNRLEFSDSITEPGAMSRHFYITGGSKIDISEEWAFVPSIMLRGIPFNAFQVDLNAKLRYRDMLWGGIGYRRTDGMVAMVGMLIKNTFEVGYSYDLITSSLNSFTGGTHEILVGVRFGVQGRLLCPSDYW